MIHYLAVIFLIIPAIINRHSKWNFVLILMFISQCLVQSYFEEGDPYVNYLFITAATVAFVIYCALLDFNRYWRWLTYLTVACIGANLLSIVLFLLTNSNVVSIELSLLFLDILAFFLYTATLGQAYLIIKATDGYSGMHKFINNLYRDFPNFITSHFRNKSLSEKKWPKK